MCSGPDSNRSSSASIAPAGMSARSPCIATAPQDSNRNGWRYANNFGSPSTPSSTKRPPAYETCYVKRKPRMNLDNLTHASGEWLRGTGSESDIVISSRIRLARNLAAFLFTNRASPHQKSETESMLRERIAKLETDPRLSHINLPPLTT